MRGMSGNTWKRREMTWNNGEYQSKILREMPGMELPGMLEVSLNTEEMTNFTLALMVRLLPQAGGPNILA